MSKMSPKKLAKKKEREKEVKKKLKAKRDKLRVKNKEESIKEKENIEARKTANRINGVTIRKDKTDHQFISNQLAHNYEILKALEAEHDAMKKQQQNSNQINTNTIPQQFLLKPPTEKKGFKASAEVVFKPNPEPSSEVKETDDSGK